MTGEVLYQFATYVPTSRSLTNISIVRSSVAKACFSRTEMTDLFGGLAKYEHKKTGEEWIGVWSNRKASKFRRLLRERGVTLMVVKSIPSGLRLKVAYYGRPLDSSKRS